jgi:hypothetical protein
VNALTTIHFEINFTLLLSWAIKDFNTFLSSFTLCFDQSVKLEVGQKFSIKLHNQLASEVPILSGFYQY